MKRIFYLGLFLLLTGSGSVAQAQRSGNIKCYDHAVAEYAIQENPYAVRAASFAQEDQNNPPQHGVLFTGSSTLDFWRPWIPEQFADFEITNTGIGGTTLKDMMLFGDQLIFRYNPEVMLLYIGDNDIFSYAPAEFADLFSCFMKNLYHHYPKLNLIVLSIKPSPSRAERFEEYRLINGALEQTLKRYKRATLIDIWTPMLTSDGAGDPSYFGPDLLHMNKKGYDLVASKVRPLLEDFGVGRK